MVLKDKIAIVGSGPAGWSCADELNKAGHNVTVFERDDKVGGIMRYGIPEFRLPVRIIDDQFAMLASLGVIIKTDVFVGSTTTMSEIFSLPVGWMSASFIQTRPRTGP